MKLAFLALALAGCAESEPSTPPRPRVSFVETVRQLGEVRAGTEVRTEFRFANSGDAALSVRALICCGCRAEVHPRSPIPPGGNGRVLVVCRIPRRTWLKEIHVHTNDPSAPSVQLLLAAGTPRSRRIELHEGVCAADTKIVPRRTRSAHSLTGLLVLAATVAATVIYFLSRRVAPD